jgi:hypothetical protein
VSVRAGIGIAVSFLGSNSKVGLVSWIKMIVSVAVSRTVSEGVGSSMVAVAVAVLEGGMSVAIGERGVSVGRGDGSFVGGEVDVEVGFRVGTVCRWGS